VAIQGGYCLVLWQVAEFHSTEPHNYIAIFIVIGKRGFLPLSALFKACSYGERLDLAVSAAFLHRGEP